MEQLHYVVEESIIAQLLGVQNFSNKESAILELVKNAYDANASTVKIIVKDNTIDIIDDGIGMTSADIKNAWIHIGKSNKKYKIVDNNAKERVLAGSKGIGRFALARLGEDVTIETKKDKCDAIQWHTDWNTNTLQTIEKNIKNGTSITIKDLRDNWNEKAVDNLCDYLKRTYRDDSMKIELFYNEKEKIVRPIFENLEIGVNYSAKIKLNYRSKSHLLKIDITSDEFLPQAQQYSEYDINRYTNEINIENEFISQNIAGYDLDSSELLEKLGDFSSELYFGLGKVSSKDKERFLYKREMLDSQLLSGIILYRNAFSISSYEGSKDWLGIEQRARKSPAAATHETGSWRVRLNQIYGNVNIDKIENEELRDLSNRQGIEENIYYNIFIDIINTGLKDFERYRQRIIRKICAATDKKNVVKSSISDSIVKNPNSIKNLKEEDYRKLASEISDYKKQEREYKKTAEETIEGYRYDVRILNVLATSGLKATSIAHEMRNDRSNIEGSYDFIVNALKSYDMWDTLNLPENTKKAYKNVPDLLEKNKKSSIKILRFMNVMLNNVEKRQFIPKDYNVFKLVEKIKERWERDYAWLKINIVNSGIETFKLSEDILGVVFDNLILNSIQQNGNINGMLNINIEIDVTPNNISIVYNDNGIGLPDKYKRDPKRILEPHETSRENGHGLGMWILNNTVTMTGGEVLKIESDNGFKISFTIGGKNNGNN